MMKKSLAFLFLFITFFSCDRFTANDSFDLNESDRVTINKTVLSKDQISDLNFLLNDLRATSEDTYSKPNYTIRSKVGSETKIISVFVKESFVYKGDYLNSWTERMTGEGSKGYKLNSKLLSKLKEWSD